MLITPNDDLLTILRRQYSMIKNDLMIRTMAGRKVRPKEWHNLTLTQEMIYDEAGITHVVLNADASIDPSTGLMQGDPYARVAWWDTAHGGKKPKGSGKLPRKIRKRKVRRDVPKERWIIHGAQDELCLRYDGTVWEVNTGPIPETDTHPNCKCERIAYRARKSDPAGLFRA